MAALGLAFRAFFGVLKDSAFAAQVRRLIEAGPVALAMPQPATKAPAPAPSRQQVRNDAINLLAVLQREGRWVDFVKEPINAFSDAQIGAAVRDVHRDCGAAMERMFALRPVLGQSEGENAEAPAGFDAGRIRLTGNVAGNAPFKGTLRHAGWEATKVELPEWTGGQSAARVVAPAEIEIG